MSTRERWSDGSQVRRDSRYAMGGDTGPAEGLKVGDKVWLADDERPMIVRARGSRYIILTKPFNAKRTVLYSVIDLALGTRGTDNYGGLGYETDEQIARAMAMFDSGEAEISTRNNVRLDIRRVEPAGGGLTDRHRRVLNGLCEVDHPVSVEGLRNRGLLPDPYYGPTLFSLYRRGMVEGTELTINSAWADHTNWEITTLGRECLIEGRLAPIIRHPNGTRIS